jgi:SnoaL-like domain
MDLTAAEMAQLAHDRFEIADTLHRYAFGLDHGDPDSLASAFTEDCVIDFTSAARKLGIDFPVLTGRERALQILIPMLGPLDTSHTTSNLQIEVSGDTATLHGYLMSQHFMPGQGHRRGSDYALLMNRYDAELVRAGTKWRFKRVTIDNAWAEGDPGIITALATHRVARAKSKQSG